MIYPPEFVVTRISGRGEPDAALIAAAPELLALVRSYRTTYPLDEFAEIADALIAKAKEARP